MKAETVAGFSSINTIGCFCLVSLMTTTLKDIQNALGKFAKVLLWEESEGHMNRLLVRARVNDMQKVAPVHRLF
jgi:hypothetical protein